MLSPQISWFGASLIAMLSFACMALTLKRLTYLLPTPIVLLYVFLMTGVMYLVYGIRRGLEFGISLQAFLLLVLACVFSFIGNYGDVESLRLAPNPGYAAAVKAGQILVLTFVALALFPEQKLSVQGFCGVALVFAGIVLLAMQK